MFNSYVSHYQRVNGASTSFSHAMSLVLQNVGFFFAHDPVCSNMAMDHPPSGDFTIRPLTYPLVMTNIAIEHNDLCIVDLPIENGDFP